MIKLFIISILYLIIPIQNVQAEISSKRVLNDIFEGCMEESVEDTSLGVQYEYCGCMINRVSQLLTTEEVLKLGLELERIGDDEEAALDFFFENDQLTDSFITCAAKAYE